MNLPRNYDEQQPAFAAAMGRGVYGSVDTVEDDRLNFRHFINLLRRRMRLFLTIVALMLTLGVLVTLLQPKIYQASAVVLLKNSGQKLEERVNDRAEQPSVAGDADVSTEIQVIGSRELARRVLRSEKLMQNPGFNTDIAPAPSLLQRLLGKTPEGIDITALDPAARRNMEDRLVRRVRAGLTASRIGTAYSVQIGYRHENPDIAAQLANAYAREYTRSQVYTEQAAVGEATAFISRKVEDLRRQATADFAAVQRYRVEHGLLSNSATALAEQDISVYNQQEAAARAEASADMARLATARRQLSGGSAGDDVGEALSSPVVSAMRTQRAQMAGQVAELASRYGNRHPELTRAREELAAIDGQIQAEIDRVISNLEAKVAVSSQRLASLSGSLGSAKGELARNNEALVTLDDLQRRSEASQGLYESYLARYRKLVANSGAEQSEARVLTDAVPPMVPSSPKVLLNLLLAGMGGIVIGIVSALATEMQFKGLTTAQDVERRVGLPHLGLIPENASLAEHAESPLATLEQMPNSVLAEAVRAIYSATHIPVVGRGKVLAISSALPDEGKTVLSAMLGRTASDMGLSVLIMDCDIIARGLSVLNGVSGGPDLRDVAAGRCSLDAALRYLPDSNVALLPLVSGSGPGERLTDNKAIQAVVSQVKDRFDLILLDCPPLLAIAEAREIAGLADGVILAALWRKTEDSTVRAAARLLPAHLAAFTGVTLTRIDLRKQQKYASGDCAPYTAAYQRYLAAAA